MARLRAMVAERVTGNNAASASGDQVSCYLPLRPDPFPRTKAGRVCELMRSSRSKFKWFGISSVQFPCLIGLAKCPIQFSSFSSFSSVHSVQFTNSSGPGGHQPRRELSTQTGNPATRREDCPLVGRPLCTDRR